MQPPSIIELQSNPPPPTVPGGVSVVKWAQDGGFPINHVAGYVPSGGGGGGSVGAASFIDIALTPSAPGNFTVAHGLGSTPKFVLIQMTSGGQIWLQSPTSFDGTNIYLTASDAGVTGIASVWTTSADAEISLAPTAPGNFSVPHGLGFTPNLALIEMRSSGRIWFNNPTPWDGTNLYLIASDAGVAGKAEVFLNQPSNISTANFVKIALTPSAPGNFTVAHNLGRVPTQVIVRMSSGGNIWLQNPTGYDATNLYLVASDAGVIGEAEVWATPSLPSPTEIALTPSAPGNFTIAHGLGVKPKVAFIQMTSGGSIWFQTARYDSTNLYLTASDGGITGYAEAWI